jgi:hypothetical protein
VVLAFFEPGTLMTIYANKGLDAVAQEVLKLRNNQLI